MKKKNSIEEMQTFEEKKFFLRNANVEKNTKQMTMTRRVV